jgi:hypothetical protein
VDTIAIIYISRRERFVTGRQDESMEPPAAALAGQQHPLAHTPHTQLGSALDQARSPRSA